MYHAALPQVSVVVAVYNAEPYLSQCLDSIIQQTLRNIEIICVNDGSTDSSLQTLEDYAARDKRIRVYTKKNEGLGGASARNYGMAKATGEYLSILDSDDFFEKDMLEKAVHKAEKLQADIVVFGGCEYDNETESIKRVPSILNQKVIPALEVFSYHDCPNQIFQISQGMAWNKLYRKGFLDQHKITFQKIKYTDDAYFTFANMILAERIAVIKDSLCYYRVNSGSNQTSGLTNYPDSAFIPYLTLQKVFQEWGVYQEIERSFLNCAVTFMRHCYDSINRFDVFEYLHEKYKNEIFPQLGVMDKANDYFYDGRVYQWIEEVNRNSAGELAFKSVQAYGGSTLTGVLRFQFPYDKVPYGSKIALIGSELIGRYYYAEVMLRAYCDVVIWAGSTRTAQFSYIHEYSALKKGGFEYAVIAYADPQRIEEAVSYLRSIGMAENKIIREEEK